MLDLHYWTTPNGHKITMFLEGPNRLAKRVWQSSIQALHTNSGSFRASFSLSSLATDRRPGSSSK
jgi:hypothetical protein